MSVCEKCFESQEDCISQDKDQEVIIINLTQVIVSNGMFNDFYYSRQIHRNQLI